MDMASVETDLQRRIDQSREWVSGKPALITDLKIRRYPCLAEPVLFLDDPHREERHGIRFRLEFVTDLGTYESFIDVRIKATRSMSKDGKSVANAPYIIIYALNYGTQEEESITYEYLKNTRYYKGTLSKSIDEWYKDWLLTALLEENTPKIFKFKNEKRYFFNI